MSYTRLAMPACMLTLFAVLAPQAASAITRDLYFQANASGVCQAALPAYEGLIRKRPLGVFNEGDAPAFVTCSPTSLQDQPLNSWHVFYFYNQGGSAATINCMGVIGTQGVSMPVYIAKSVNIAAGTSNNITWSAADGVTTNRAFNISCEMPAGTGITATYMSQILDVGS